MNVLPKNTFLGELKIADVFEFFDFPLLFTCIDNHRQVYLAVAIDESPENIKWLYSPISDETLYNLRESKIDFKSAFQASKNGFSFVISTFNDGSSSSITPIVSDDIPDEHLPEAGEFFQSGTDERATPYYADVKEIADKTDRGILNLILDVKNKFNFAPARHLGIILGDLQSFVDALGYRISGHAQSLRGRIPSMITDQTELDVAFSFPGSFGIQLRSYWNTGDASFTLVEESLKTFIKLIELQNDREALIKALSDLDQRSVSKYSNLLDSVSRFGNGFACQYGSPKLANKISSSISIDKVRDNLVLAREIERMSEEISVDGIIKGIFIRHKRFDIVDRSGDSYTGTILDEAMEQASHAKINSSCVAILLRENLKSKATDTIKTRWNLLSLEVNESIDAQESSDQ